MSLRINYVSGSDNGLRALNSSYRSLMKSMQKLSTGLRINQASDNPAGLVISERMRSQIASLNQKISNTSLTIKKYETADSAVGQLRSVLTDVRTMALGAANSGFNDSSVQSAYNQAAGDAVSTYNRMINDASFNNANLLDGSEGSLADVSQLSGIDLSSPEQAKQSLEAIDQAMAELDATQVSIGSTQKNELERSRSNMEITVQNLTAAESTIRDTDIPFEIAVMLRNQIQIQAGMSMLAHANFEQRSVLKLFSFGKSWI